MITIEVLRGGFIMEYPNVDKGGETEREVFVTQRKLNQKLSEVILEINRTLQSAEEK